VLLTNNIKITRELHIIQAHLLHYHSLLQDFQKSVDFLQRTPNPAIESDSYTPEERKESMELMVRECANLLSEIDRLENRRTMQSSRLKNVMDLAFATVNIQDSKHMQKLTEATVRDSSAMKQVCLFVFVVFAIVAELNYYLYPDFVPDDGIPSRFLHCGMCWIVSNVYG
jgi:hypothetical protein